MPSLHVEIFILNGLVPDDAFLQGLNLMHFRVSISISGFFIHPFIHSTSTHGSPALCPALCYIWGSKEGFCFCGSYPLGQRKAINKCSTFRYYLVPWQKKKKKIIMQGKDRENEGGEGSQVF